jgi:hypothetical protein
MKMIQHSFIQVEPFFIISFENVIIVDEEVPVVFVDPLLQLIKVPDEQKQITKRRKQTQYSCIEQEILKKLYQSEFHAA